MPPPSQTSNDPAHIRATASGEPASGAGEAGLAARAAAVELVEAGLRSRSGLDEALASPALRTLDGRDRAFARRLALTVLRRLGPVDQALQGRLKKPPPETVVNLLRVGATQLLYLDVPAFAAVSTTVDLAERGRGTKPFKGLINGVLRALARSPRSEPDPSVHLPPWLYARWRAAYGEPAALAIAARVPEEPATDLSFQSPPSEDELAALEASLTGGGSARSLRRGDVAEWPGFADGRWWVQDAAAAIPVRLLAPAAGETALDLCAAPGGKTLQLAAAGAKVTALDRSAARLERVRENLERVGLAAEVVTADAAAWEDARQFDAVLLDAPCTATGTFRRHPDVLWAARPGDIAKLAAAQARLLEAAADRTRPGGRLVYCVCSLEPEEGEAQVEAFLKRRTDFVLAPAQVGEGGAPAECVTTRGELRVLPSVQDPPGGMDGFFVARFSRRPS